ncbi:MAG TPA: RNA-binding protein [Puia sp.]|jgi:RNA recognition motif-containing protein|nr:RNA-binding protein [Puia sp.]
MQIRVGNLNIMTTARQLAELFLPFGKVSSSKIVCSDPKGRSRGMGFIEMDRFCGKQAIGKLHQLKFMNSYIDVDEVLG